MEEKLKKQVHERLEQIVEQDNLGDNLDLIYKLVDIHKDLSNEEYWKKKEDYMRYKYGNYGENYSRGNYSEGSYGRRARDSRGRYTGEYGRRYRGEEYIDDMKETYRGYSEGREQYGRGNYGAKEDSMKSLEAMLESTVCFLEMLKKETSSQDEYELIEEYIKHISEL